MRIGRLKIWLRLKRLNSLGFTGIKYVRSLRVGINNPSGRWRSDIGQWSTFQSREEMKATIEKDELVDPNYGYTTCWFWFLALTLYTPLYLSKQLGSPLVGK